MNIELFLGTVQDYKRCRDINAPQFDLAFIDANHDVNFVVDDFEATESLIGERGLVLLHDTWPMSVQYSDPRVCGDAYKAVDILRKKYSDWNFVTIQKHPGLTLAQRVSILPMWAVST
jgi:predicted O-methyltransferase YrrM